MTTPSDTLRTSEQGARAAVGWLGEAGEWTGPYAAAVNLDAWLGDPADPANPYGFAAMCHRDEQAIFPTDLAEAVGPSLRLSFVPPEHGGTLSTMDDTLAMVRVAARRDVAAMPATMFSITAATCVLLSGSSEQRDRVVDLLRGGGAVGFALSEPEHGSDLLANECSLTRREDCSLRLDGRKWLVGLGGRCGALLVVARSGGRGPAAFSAVLADGDAVRSAREATPQHPAGMRGIDFAGFRFDDTSLPAEAIIGAPGRGMETAMRAMQLVRAMSTAANLACADTGLRLTTDFARTHRIRATPLLDHQHTRRELGTAAAALIACDVVALTCARSLHTDPTAVSLRAGVAKKVLTELSEEVFSRCADVLGTRGLLRDTSSAGAIFDTLRRDNAVVRHIDTGPIANLRQVAMQLGRVRGLVGAEPSDSLAATFALDAALPAFEPAGLALSCRSDDVVAALSPVAQQAERTLRTHDGALSVELVREVDRELAESRLDSDPVDDAERFCFLHAAACCVHLWWFSRHLPLFGAPRGDTGWLDGTVRLLLDRARGDRSRLPAEPAEPLVQRVTALHGAKRLVSAVPLPLVESDRSGTDREDDRRSDG